jgi:hypothetical protein
LKSASRYSLSGLAQIVAESVERRDHDRRAAGHGFDYRVGKPLVIGESDPMYRSALQRFDRKHSTEPNLAPPLVIVFRREIERSCRPGEDANVGTGLPQTRQVALVAKLGPTMTGIEKRGRQANLGAAD